MHYRYSVLLRYLLLLGDLIIILLASYVTFDARHWSGEAVYTALIAWSAIFFLLSAYDVERHRILYSNITRTLRSLTVFSLTLILATYFLDKAHLASIVPYLVAIWTGILFYRFVFANAIMYYRSRGFNFRRIVFIGQHPKAFELMQRFQDQPKYGMRVLGYFGPKKEMNAHHLGVLKDITAFVNRERVDEIYCSLSPESSLSKHIQQLATDQFIKFRFVGNVSSNNYKNKNVIFFENIPVVYSQTEPLDLLHNQLAKRIYDIILSIIVLSICLPIFPLFAFLIKVSSPGPIFFIQQRSGLANKPFGLIKFRTMRQNKEADTRQATEDDPRITGIGKWLRKHNLDELPQFINVLKGEMTVVGPRPHMLLHTEEYAAIVSRFMARHAVKPGITGWAQVNGFRGETKTTKDMRKRVAFDMAYIENWNLWFDIKITLITIWQMVTGKNLQRA